MRVVLVGWWFSNCLEANLNGRYSKSDAVSSERNDGIIWNDGSGPASRKEAEMEISRLEEDPAADAN